jgi:ubiquinone/menaquinone biosynthesis C-methylase UbiE
MADNPRDTAPIMESVCETRAVRRAYDFWSHIYGQVATPLEHGPHKHALELANIQPHEKVLEVAVGPGHILLEILKRVDRTNIVYGVDLSWRMLEKSRRRVHRAGHTNVSLQEADARQLPFSDQIFDVVYSSYMLDILSLRDLATVLKEFRRVLKARGRVVLVNLSKECPQRRTWVEMLYRLLPASWVPYLLGGCRPVLLLDFMRKAGFRDAERTFIGGMMSSEIVTARASLT